MSRLSIYLIKLHTRAEGLMGARVYRLVRYLISGGTAAASNLAFLFLLVHFFEVYYLYASVIAFILSIAVSFTMQKFWTFQDSLLHDVRMQFGRYLVVLVANLVLNTLLMYVFVEYLGWWYVYAQVVATGIVAIVGYFGYRNFVFRVRLAPVP